MKFVTLSSHRSGSSLFQRLLNSHPDILARQEDLRDQDRHSRQVMLERLDGIYANDGKYKAVGFKLQYSHVRPWILDYIKRKDIKAIHLIRKSMLDTVFWYRGNYTGKTIGGFGSPLLVPEGSEIVANIDNVIASLRWIRKEIKKYEKITDFRVYYESFTAGGINVSRFANNDLRKKLLNFLSVEDRELTTDQKKAQRKPLKELVVNYEKMLSEIKRRGVKIYL